MWAVLLSLTFIPHVVFALTSNSSNYSAQAQHISSFGGAIGAPIGWSASSPNYQSYSNLINTTTTSSTTSTTSTGSGGSAFVVTQQQNIVARTAFTVVNPNAPTPPAPTIHAPSQAARKSDSTYGPANTVNKATQMITTQIDDSEAVAHVSGLEENSPVEGKGGSKFRVYNSASAKSEGDLSAAAGLWFLDGILLFLLALVIFTTALVIRSHRLTLGVRRVYTCCRLYPRCKWPREREMGKGVSE